MRVQIQNQLSIGVTRVSRLGLRRRPVPGQKPGRFAAIMRVQQGMRRTMVLAQIQFIIGVERLDSGHERMLRIAHLDAVGMDRGVGQKLAAEHRHEVRRVPRRVPAPALQEIQHGVGAVQRQPAPSGGEKAAQGIEFVGLRDLVACIGDQEVGGSDCLPVTVIGADPHANALVFCEQFEQFEPGIIHIMIEAAADQVSVDR